MDQIFRFACFDVDHFRKNNRITENLTYEVLGVGILLLFKIRYSLRLLGVRAGKSRTYIMR